ncbi:hypothetical protein ACIP5Y_35895 [Nocardia sp. NPDC088792]|uniref:hypothetical protein n=1 Tax=Nocardia sp. NPDC088792 TaxID=3364332 RepID=UPI00382320D0
MIRKTAAVVAVGLAAATVAAGAAHADRGDNIFTQADRGDKAYEWPIDFSGESFAIRPGSWLLYPLPESNACIYAFEPNEGADPSTWWGVGKISGPTWVNMPANAYLVSDCYPFDDQNTRRAPSLGTGSAGSS